MNNISIGDFIRQAEDTERQRTAIALTPIINYGMQYIQALKAKEQAETAKRDQMDILNYKNILETDLMNQQQDRLTERETTARKEQQRIAAEAAEEKKRQYQERLNLDKEKLSLQEKAQALEEIKYQEKSQATMKEKTEKKAENVQKRKDRLEKSLVGLAAAKQTALDNGSDNNSEYIKVLDAQMNGIKSELRSLNLSVSSEDNRIKAKKINWKKSDRGLQIYSFTLDNGEREDIVVPNEIQKRIYSFARSYGVTYSDALLKMYNDGLLRAKGEY